VPLQNRVDPFGTIFRTPARGTIMGNRGGALHNDRREIVRNYKNQRWITCVLEFKGRWRPVMTPRRYTELFFLDEAVSFAAGHRPCCECRRERYLAFREAWGKDLRATDLDAELHRARQLTYKTALESLPNGAFVAIDEAPYLVWNDGLFLWTPERYAIKERRPEDLEVTVLTPRPVVECFRRGYEPQVHDSVIAAVHSGSPSRS
jgi:hypothetical protein